MNWRFLIFWRLIPVALIVWSFYVLPFWLLGWIYPAHRRNGYFVFLVKHKKGPMWWQRYWEKWAGHALPFAVIVRHTFSEKLLKHEGRHVDQWYVLGTLFPVVYGVLLPFYGYHDHPLERDARKAEER